MLRNESQRVGKRENRVGRVSVAGGRGAGRVVRDIVFGLVRARFRSVMAVSVCMVAMRTGVRVFVMRVTRVCAGINGLRVNVLCDMLGAHPGMGLSPITSTDQF